MTGTNHVITGALIGSVAGTPLLAIPLAVMSHFLLDALPHYGDPHLAKNEKRFHRIIIVDTVLVVSFLTAVLVTRPTHWLMMIIAGLVALSPDMMWLPNYIRLARKKAVKSYNKLMHWHERIQFERRWGIAIEAAWFVAVLPSLYIIVSA